MQKFSGVGANVGSLCFVMLLFDLLIDFYVSFHLPLCLSLWPAPRFSQSSDGTMVTAQALPAPPASDGGTRSPSRYFVVFVCVFSFSFLSMLLWLF